MAEMMSSLHGIMFRQRDWFDHYSFVNDAGHTENGIYALRANYGFDNSSIQSLWDFRSQHSPLTGHGEAHVNPSGVFISNGPLGSGLPQAQGLALAEHLACGKRITVCTISDGACMEGEAKESLSAIPGLSRRGILGPFLLLISNNNTKLSGRIDQDSFSQEPTFASLAPLGWEVETIKEGNHLPTVHHAIDQALGQIKNNPQQPQALIFHTIKGKGVRSTEESASGGHGHPLKPQDPRLIDFIREIYHPEEPPQEFIQEAEKLLSPPSEKHPPSSSNIKREKIQAGISRAAISAAQKGLPIYSISSDLQGSTGMGAFHKTFPEKSLDIGVAEANMISTAIGLSKRGWIPIVDTFSQFGVTKGNLPLIMSGLSQAPVIAIFSPHWFSRCCRWCQPSSHHLFFCSGLHTSHSHRILFLFGRSRIFSDPCHRKLLSTTQKKYRTRKCCIFYGTRKLSYPLYERATIPMERHSNYRRRGFPYNLGQHWFSIGNGHSGSNLAQKTWH